MNKYPFPKVDLHCHLDGSLVHESIYNLAKERNIDVPGETLEGFIDYMVATANVKDFYEYLERFNFPTLVLQDKEALVKSTYDLLERLDSLGLVYAEIRFAPQLHTKKGMTMDQVVEAVLEGVDQAQKNFKIEAGIILCCMNFGDSKVNIKENLETVELVKKYLGKGVVLLDLAGAEGTNEMEEYRYIFDRATELELPFIVHAGEGGGSQHVATALTFNPLRIGHGANSIKDPKVMEEVIGRKIPLEVCITSNVQCHICDTYSDHPIKKQYDMGTVITINTDNMSMATTTLDDEYDHLINECGFTVKDIVKCNINSVNASRMSEDKKAYWINELENYLTSL